MRYKQTSDRYQYAPLKKRKSSAIRQFQGASYETLTNLPIQTEEVRLSAVIMAHKKREAFVSELVEQLNIPVVWDKYNDRHETGLRAILEHDDDATHHLVIQDDAIPAIDLLEGLKIALKYVDPNSPVGLYHGGKGKYTSAHRQAWLAADTSGASWLIRQGPIWGPGIVYPTHTIPELKKWYENSSIENYDKRVMYHYQSKRINCWYTVPCLVEHRQEQNPSLCNHNAPNRVSARFLGPQSAVTVDWAGIAVREK